MLRELSNRERSGETRGGPSLELVVEKHSEPPAAVSQASSLTLRHIVIRSPAHVIGRLCATGGGRMPFPVPPKYIEEAERALGAPLPDGYRLAMERRNGGEVLVDGETWWLHPIWDKSSHERLSRTCNHVVTETARWIEWTGVPEGAVAIGQMAEVTSSVSYARTRASAPACSGGTTRRMS